MRELRESAQGNGNYRKLRVWRAGIELVEMVYHLTGSFPGDERYGLTSQMRRAAISVPSNLAEGNERTAIADRRRFVVMARGSIAELETQLEISVRLGFADSNSAKAVFEQTDSIGRMLTRLRMSLER